LGVDEIHVRDDNSKGHFVTASFSSVAEDPELVLGRADDGDVVLARERDVRRVAFSCRVLAPVSSAKTFVQWTHDHVPEGGPVQEITGREREGGPADKSRRRHLLSFHALGLAAASCSSLTLVLQPQKRRTQRWKAVNGGAAAQRPVGVEIWCHWQIPRSMTSRGGNANAVRLCGTRRGSWTIHLLKSTTESV
jgi:hypothetical protein